MKINNFPKRASVSVNFRKSLKRFFNTNKFLFGLTLAGTLFFSQAAFSRVYYQQFFTNDSVIIYGTQNQDTLRSENITASSLRAQNKATSQVMSDTRISQRDLVNYNLVILGTPGSNKILDFSNQPFVQSSFPVQIAENYFTFGNKNYRNSEDGIAFMYPSPYNPNRFVLVYYSNSQSGLENLVKTAKNLNSFDYRITSGTNILREGRFNKDGIGWAFDSELDVDYQARKPISGNLEEFSSENFNLFYDQTSEAAYNIEQIANQSNNFYNNMVELTNRPINEKINLYIFESEEEIPDNQASNEIHVLMNSNSNNLYKELSDFFYRRSLNFINDPQIRSGFVEYASDLYANHLDTRAGLLYRSGSIPDLLAVFQNNTVNETENIITGSFTKYLINNFGFENYQAVVDRARSMNSSEKLANISPSFNYSFSRLEREWKYSLSSMVNG